MANTARWIGLAVAAAAGALAVSRSGRARNRIVAARSPARAPIETRARNARRDVNRAAALLATAALADSGFEHYRGAFHNRTMYVPLGVAALTLVASAREAARPNGDAVRHDAVVDGLAISTGVIGSAFHLYNVAKRPGGISWLNLFYAAPLGAPAALSLAGLLRVMAHRLRDDGDLSSGRLLAALVAAGLLGTSAEAGLLHFRGAFHNPAMTIPVTIPPIAAALLARAAWTPRGRHPMTRWSLRLLAAAGLLGAGFHAYGVERNMGGWRNWSQNLLNGPPLPAPPAFTALALAGLAALSLTEGDAA